MKKITIYDNEFWIKKGFSEEDAILKVNQCKKENSCWNKEFWIKKGFSEEDAILKVKEKQKQNSLKQDKSKIENLYLIETWIKKGFSEEDAILKVNELKEKSNIYKNLPSCELDNILIKRKKTFYSKDINEIKKINKSKGRTKKELIDKYGEEYVNDLLINRGKGRRNSFFRRYSKISELFFNELQKQTECKLLYGKNEIWIKYNKNKGYYVDLLIENTNKIIEFNGDFYHANPFLYDKDSIINISKTTIKKAEEIWEQDLLKINKLNELGYDVLIIWEYDVLKNKQQIINECINFIKK